LKIKLIRDLFNNNKASSLMKNKYGSYVVQKAIYYTRDFQLKEIKEILFKKLNKPDLTSKESERFTSILELINNKS